MKKYNKSEVIYKGNACFVTLAKTGEVIVDKRPSAVAQRQLTNFIADKQSQLIQRQLTKKIIQRRKFKDDEAKTWLSTKLSDDNIVLPDEGDEWEFLENQLASDENLAEDSVSNINSLLGVWNEVRAEAVSRRELAGLVKKRTLTDKQKDHILKGEFKNGKITGGHHAPTCMQNGFTITNIQPIQDGFYTASLNITDSRSKTTTKSSTFFPDAWSAADIINAIEYAERPIPAQPRYIIVTSKGNGITLHSNEDSYFPIFS